MPNLVLANWDAFYHMLDTLTRINIEEVRSVAVVKKKITEVEGGIFDRKMGGLIDTEEETREFCCDCKALRGKFYAGQVCPTCNTVVKDQFFADITKYGWIDLYPYYVIQPNAYAMVEKVIGATALNKIIKHEMNLDINGIPIKKEVDKSSPYDGIGLIEFKRKFENILLHYASKAKDKPDKIANAKMLIEQKNRVFCSKIPVVNSLLRSTFTSNSRKGIKADDINAYYITILKNVDIIRRNANRISRISIINNLTSVQEALNELYSKIVKSKLSGKKQLIRGKILGARLSFSSRMVITPLLDDEYFGLDHVVISYKAFLELFNLEIINLIMNDPGTGKFARMTPFEIINYITLAKYSKKVDEDLYALMDYLIKKHTYGLWVLINRNPTLSLGSTQSLKIVHVIKDVISAVLRVPASLLRPMNGDHDGDVLNAYSFKEKCVAEAFKNAFAPSALVIDKTGANLLNNEFNIYKDVETGLWGFTTPHKEFKVKVG